VRSRKETEINGSINNEREPKSVAAEKGGRNTVGEAEFSDVDPRIRVSRDESTDKANLVEKRFGDWMKPPKRKKRQGVNMQSYLP